MAFDFINKKTLDKIKEVISADRIVMSSHNVTRKGPRTDLRRITSKGTTYKRADGSYTQGFTLADLSREMKAISHWLNDLVYNDNIPPPTIDVLVPTGVADEFPTSIYTASQAKCISNFVIDFYNKPKSLDIFFKYIKDKGLKYE